MRQAAFESIGQRIGGGDRQRKELTGLAAVPRHESARPLGVDERVVLRNLRWTCSIRPFGEPTHSKTANEHPPRFTSSLFSIFCPQNIHNTGVTRARKSLRLNILRDSRQNIHNKGVTGSRKSLPLNILRHSRQDILSKADARKTLRTKHLSVPLWPLIFKDRCRPTLSHNYGACEPSQPGAGIAGFQRSLPPPGKPFTISATAQGTHGAGD